MNYIDKELTACGGLSGVRDSVVSARAWFRVPPWNTLQVRLRGDAPQGGKSMASSWETHRRIGWGIVPR